MINTTTTATLPMTLSGHHFLFVAKAPSTCRLDRQRTEGFGSNAANRLRRSDGFPHCPDILVNCIYDVEANGVAPLGSSCARTGEGGWQNRPFALVPTDWNQTAGPIVGLRACTTLQGLAR